MQESSRPDMPLGTDNHELETLLGRALEEKSIWAGLIDNLRDAFFAPKLPPLELTSTPIPVPDRMTAKTNPWAVGTATIVNGGILALVLCFGLKVVVSPNPKLTLHSRVNLSDLNIFAPLKAHAERGGSGSGANDLVDPIQGRLPKFEKTPLAPPQIPLIENPKLSIDPAIAMPPDVKLPDNPTIPNIGVYRSPNVSLLSGGPGTHGGIGTGSDDGIGSAKGNSYGANEGIYVPGGAVSAPIPIVTPEAEFSDEARRSKYQGVCMISIIVDAHGYPQNPRALQSVGMGLDEKALDAVGRYRFKPALKDGRPVPVRIAVAVNFRLY